MPKNWKMIKVSDIEKSPHIEKPKLASNKKYILLNKIKSLLEGSTSHGIPNLMRTNRISIKILWALCFLASVSFCSYMVFKIVADFLNYETVSKIERITEIESKFPTISFCNVNPFTTSESEQLLLSFVPANVSLNDLDFRTKYGLIVLANRDAQVNSFNPEFGDANRKKLGYNLSKILISCVFDDEPCSADDFEWYYDLSFGNCYRFNSGRSQKGRPIEQKKTKKPGPKDGLLIQLFNIPSQNKISSVLSEGLVLFIHNQSISPSASMGVNVDPSKQTDISIQRTFIQKEPYPYSDCIDLNNFNSDYYKFLIGLNRTYRQQDCFDLCLQKKIIDLCDCYDLSFPMVSNSTPCLSLEQFNCTRFAYVKFKSSKINEECLALCPLECESINYDLLISSTASLSKQGYDSIEKLIDRFTSGFSQNKLTYDEVRQRFIVLNVYYADLSYVRISETPKTSFFDLLSNLGGTLGLYIGISFLSLVELVEIFLETIFLSFNLNL